MKRGPWQVLRAGDRLLNALTLGDGSHTVSARAGYAQSRGKGWARALAPVINAVAGNPAHCLEAARAEGLLPTPPTAA